VVSIRASELVKIMDRNALDRDILAELVGFTPRTVTRWRTGASSIPRAIGMIAEMIDKGEFPNRYFRKPA